MAIIESTATALVRFTGLGMICFNEQQNLGEIALIRDEKHELSIEIQQPKFKDGVENDLIVYENIASFTKLPKENVSIEITTNGNSTFQGYEVYENNGEFNRLESEDFNDFRWVVDMNNLHEEELSFSNSENRYPITKLSIENGLYYVHKLDTELFFEKVEKNLDGEKLNKETFGNVAETIGVKLEADEVLFKISIDGNEESFNLKQNNGLPYRIEIKNMNYDEDADISDMPDYYKYVASSDNRQFELDTFKDSSDSAPAGGITAKRFCHPVRINLDSVDSIA